MAAGSPDLPPEDKPTLESEFIEMLIASERVGQLVDQIIQANSEHRLALKRRKQAVLDLAVAVEAKETYAVEARLAGAVDVVTALLKDFTGDEELTQSACTIITACSGALSCGGRVQEFAFGPGFSVRVQEGSLAEGLGVRVWAVAHCLARELVRDPSIVRGKSVLEIGAGTGLCGIVAARLGASEVVLTDYEERVLLNLRGCVAANAAAATQLAQPDAGNKGAAAQQEAFDDEELFGEGADECDDLDGFMMDAAAGAAPDQAALIQSWDHGSMRVRYMDWNDDLQRLNRRSTGEQDANGACSGDVRGASPERDEGQLPPGLGSRESFDVILGSDVLYEAAHAEMVAAVLALRLKHNGAALIGMAVREEAMMDDAVLRMERLGMEVTKQQVEPCMETHTVLGHARDYEGGFVLLHITKRAAGDACGHHQHQ